MNLTLNDWLTLALAVVVIGLALLAEHLLTGYRGWPQRWYYAEGLLAELIGLLGWAALRHVQVDWLAAGAMLAAGLLAGGPDFLWLRHEQQIADRAAAERAADWARLEASNADLAAQLRCLLAKSTTSKYMGRLREMLETAAFATAAIKQEREAIDVAQRQQAQLLAQIAQIMGQTE